MRPLGVLTALAALATLVLVSARPASAVQTFPDPFGGEGTFVDLRAGSTGQDIGDVFMLREGTTFRVRIFLDPPSTFIESHICVSADPFTQRIQPGQCQYSATGAASGTYDVVVPPSAFPTGTVPFTDGLGPFCAQIHVAYSAPGLARTARGGGTAYGGWQPGSPFFGNICLPAVPEPGPPDPALTVDKTGSFSSGSVSFTVTVENPTTTVAPNVTVFETLPPELTWTLPPPCVLSAVPSVARCDVGDIGGGASVVLTFTATPAVDDCGTFDNYAEALIDGVSEANDTAVVEVPCQPQPADPLILITKVPSTTTITPPGTIVYLVTVENVGPGDATNVTFTDELPAGPTWTLGSGSNVCSISGTTLSCFAPDVPDGVFEVLEIFGAVDASFCGTLDNTATITWSGGQADGSASATAPTVDVPCPAASPSPTGGAGPETGEGAGPATGGNDGELPDTSAATISDGPWTWPIVAAALFGSIGASLAWRRRSGDRRH